MNLEHYLAEGDVMICEYRNARPLDFLAHKKAGRVRSFVGKKLTEIRDEHADVYLLDGRATRVLFADFPASARFVLVRLMPRVSWIIAVPGLVRRLWIGLLSIEGIHTLEASGRKTYWLALRHKRAVVLHTRMSISDDIGVQGLLDHLRAEQIDYVILRFFEKLPLLNREGGDLDLMVSDEHEFRVKEYLQKYPGKIGVDVWTPSRTSHNSITYYPPPLAKRILASALEGPARSRIPAPKETFLALSYHALYHKGLFSGVPTRLPGLVTNPAPENNYAAFLKRMAGDLGVDVHITMEELDEYLASEGWRPKLDTLAKIAPRNAWVWHRFFSTTPAPEVGLTVFLIKKKALELGLEERIEHTIAKSGEFKVLAKKRLANDEVRKVTEHLRGGVWNDERGTGEYVPAFVIVALDTKLARSRAVPTMRRDADRGVKTLKKTLRRMFDTDKISFTHATDNTHEAKEYVHWCFSPAEATELNKKIEEELKKLEPSWLEKAWLSLRFTPRYLVYLLVKGKQRLKDRVVRGVVGR